MAELSLGVLPREYHTEEELTPQARRIWPTANTRDAASAGRHSTTTGVMHPGTTLTDSARKWSTPSASNFNDGESPESWRARQRLLIEKHVNGNGAGTPLAIQAQEQARKLWPTARGEDSESAGNHPGATDSLTGAAKLWPTAQAHDTGRSPEAHLAMRASLEGGPRTTITSLAASAKAWQTPKSGGRNAYRGGERSDEPLLTGQAQEATEAWMTPNAQGGTGSHPTMGPLNPHGLSGSNRDTWRPTLDGQARGAQPILHSQTGLRPPTTRPAGPSSSEPTPSSHRRWLTPHGAGNPDADGGFGGTGELGVQATRLQAEPATGPLSLNPAFVEWLMGLPPNWTCVCVPGQIDSEDSATRSSRPRPKPRFVSSGIARSASGRREPWFGAAASVFG